MRKITWILIAADIFIFGTIFIFSKAIIPPLNAISYLFLRSSIGVFPYILWFSSKRSRKNHELRQYFQYVRERPKEVFLFVVVFYVLTLLLVFFAVPYTTAGNLSILNSFSTTLTVLVRYLVYHKKESPSVLRSVAISTLGIFLIIYPWSFSANKTLKGDLMVLVAMVLSAFGNIYNDRLSKEMDPKFISFNVTFFPALILFPFLWIDNQIAVIRALTPSQWGIMIWLGISISGIGYAVVSYIYSDPEISAEKLGVINGMVFVIGVVLGVLIYHDSVGIVNLIGIILVLFSVFYMNMHRTSKNAVEIPD